MNARFGAVLALYGHIGLAVPHHWEQTKKRRGQGFRLNAHPIRRDTISHNCAVSANDNYECDGCPHTEPKESRKRRPVPQNSAHTEMSISGRLRITFAALMGDRSSRSVEGRSMTNAPDPKASHPPRFPGLPMAFLRILIDNPTGKMAHFM